VERDSAVADRRRRRRRRKHRQYSLAECGTRWVSCPPGFAYPTRDGLPGPFAAFPFPSHCLLAQSHCLFLERTRVFSCRIAAYKRVVLNARNFTIFLFFSLSLSLSLIRLLLFLSFSFSLSHLLDFCLAASFAAPLSGLPNRYNFGGSIFLCHIDTRIRPTCLMFITSSAFIR